MMWEEHPEYQKAQAKMLGIGLALLFVSVVAYSISGRDWHLLWQVLSAAGALLLSGALLSGAAWLIVRLFTRKRKAGHDS